MDQRNLKQSLLAGTAPKQIRMLIADGMAPIPSGELLELLILLLKDSDPQIGGRAAETLRAWDQEEILAAIEHPRLPPLDTGILFTGGAVRWSAARDSVKPFISERACCISGADRAVPSTGNNSRQPSPDHRLSRHSGEHPAESRGYARSPAACPRDRS